MFNHLANINEGIFLDQVPVIIRVRVRVVLAGGEGDGGELRGGTGLKLTKNNLRSRIMDSFSDLFESFLLSDLVSHGLRGGGANQALPVWNLNIESLTEKICF